MRKLDTIVWRIHAGHRRLYVSNAPALWTAGTPLASWLSQIDLWSPGAADQRLVELCGLVQRGAAGGDCEHRVLDVRGDAVTLCSRIDPAAARDRLAFLAEASGALSAANDPATLSTAASRLAVTELADWCVLRISSGVGNGHSLLVGHADRTQEETLRRIERRGHSRDEWPATLRGDGCTLSIDTAVSSPLFSTGTVRGEAPARARPRPDARDELIARGLTSEITVELMGQNGRLGRLTLARAQGARRYGIFDLLIATTFAQRVSMALEQTASVHRNASATRQRDQLLATVSHDLRNPLTAILAGTQGLLASAATASSPGHQRRLEAIRRSAQRMNRLAEDLLAVTELEHRGGIALRRSPNSVAALLNEAGELFEPVAAQRSQSLLVTPPMPDIRLDCDSDRVLQVLSNVIGNALKFTPDRGRIEVKAWSARDRVHFSVRDDGPGIPSHHLARVFNTGWRANPDQHRGFGLGLAIAKALVAAHGGEIWAENQAGAGATFVFTLPLVEHTGAAAVPVPGSQRRTRTPSPSLLLYAAAFDDATADLVPARLGNPN